MRLALILLAASLAGACTSRGEPTAAQLASTPASLRLTVRSFTIASDPGNIITPPVEVRNAAGELLPNARPLLVSRDPDIFIVDSANRMVPTLKPGISRLVASIGSWPGMTLRDSITVYFVCDASQTPGLRINVVDSLTGALGPLTNRMIVARNGTFVDSTLVDVPATATSSARFTALERPGHWDITVRADGYRTWIGTAEVGHNACHVILETITARLQRQ